MIASRFLTRNLSRVQSSATNVCALRRRASVISIPSGVRICGAFVLGGSRRSVTVLERRSPPRRWPDDSRLRTPASIEDCSTTSMASEKKSALFGVAF
ncbi:unnamed protein product [Musa textilis]